MAELPKVSLSLPVQKKGGKFIGLNPPNSLCSAVALMNISSERVIASRQYFLIERIAAKEAVSTTKTRRVALSLQRHFISRCPTATRK